MGWGRGAAAGLQDAGRGRGLGRGCGAQPKVGQVFDWDGPHAQQMLRGYPANDPNYLTWDPFNRAWIITAANLTGFYTQDNLRQNFHSVQKRYHDHIDPNNQSDGQFCSLIIHK